jgi:MtfA peptidase
MPIFQFFKRRWLLDRPFPDRWLRILEGKVPVYRKLPSKYRELLKQRMVIFMDEKRFEECGGMMLTEEIKIVISAYACVLILEEKADYYSGLQSILVYPNDYMAPVYELNEGGIVTEGYEHRSGEYWGGGNIVLSWSDIDKNLYEAESGSNLIYHEFSHLLDDRYGLTAGIDQDGKPLRDDEWTHVLASSYRKLQRRAYENRKSALDLYGTESPAELFSVATEAFFEKSGDLHRENPDLYRMLNSFYKLDPLRWKG